MLIILTLYLVLAWLIFAKLKIIKLGGYCTQLSAKLSCELSSPAGS